MDYGMDMRELRMLVGIIPSCHGQYFAHTKLARLCAGASYIPNMMYNSCGILNHLFMMARSVVGVRLVGLVASRGTMCTGTECAKQRQAKNTGEQRGKVEQ